VGLALALGLLALQGACGGSGGRAEAPRAAGQLSYPRSIGVFVRGTAITPMVPAGAPAGARYRVSPDLPGGLELDPGTGTLSGTPTELAPARDYTVTAESAGHRCSATLKLSIIEPAPSPGAEAGGAERRAGAHPPVADPSGPLPDSGQPVSASTGQPASDSGSPESNPGAGPEPPRTSAAAGAAAPPAVGMPAAGMPAAGVPVAGTPVGLGSAAPPLPASGPGAAILAAATVVAGPTPAPVPPPAQGSPGALAAARADGAGSGAPAPPSPAQPSPGQQSPAAGTGPGPLEPAAAQPFTASPERLEFGQTCDLGWSLGGTLTALTLADDLTGAAALDVLGSHGRLAVPVQRRQTFTLTATDAGGTRVFQRTVAARGLDFLAGGFDGPGSADGSVNAGARPHARFSRPCAIAADAAGNLYLADRRNHTIRKLTPDGRVTTLAGVAGQPGRNDSAGTELPARFNAPRALAVTADGRSIFVADTGNHRICRVTAEGLVTTLAGDPGGAGGCFDAPGTAARFIGPYALALDAAEANLYVLDGREFTLRRVTLAGERAGEVAPVTVPGPLRGQCGLAVGRDAQGAEHIYVGAAAAIIDLPLADLGHPVILAGGGGTLRGFRGGVGATARFDRPAGLAVDANGDLLVADRNNNAVRRVTTAAGAGRGTVTTLAGTGDPGRVDGPGATAQFDHPTGVLAGPGGTVLVADARNHCLRRIGADGTVSTLAGSPLPALGVANGPGLEARFRDPVGIAVNPAGDAFVADWTSHAIRRITPAGVVSTWAGSPDEEAGYIAGSGHAARFREPYGVVADPAGNLYVTDLGNACIRRIAPDGGVTLLAGAAGEEPRVEDGPALGGARFSRPTAIARDRAGNLYVGDHGCLRKLTWATGLVSTLAGVAGDLRHRDGTGAEARFGEIEGLAVTADDAVLVADTNHHVIRRVSQAGTVTPFAGLADAPGDANGPRDVARLRLPFGLLPGPGGRLYLTELGNPGVRVIAPDGSIATLVPGAPGGVGLDPGRLPGPDGQAPPVPARMVSGAGLAWTPAGDLLVVSVADQDHAGGVVQITAP